MIANRASTSAVLDQNNALGFVRRLLGDLKDLDLGRRIVEWRLASIGTNAAARGQKPASALVRH
jgi:hypothetical protein